MEWRELQFAEQNILSFGQDTVSARLWRFHNDHILDYRSLHRQRKHSDFCRRRNGNVLSVTKPGLQPPQSANWCRRQYRHARPVIFVAVDDRGGTFSNFLKSRRTGRFNDDVVFGCTSDARTTLIGDLDNDGWNDVLVVDQGRQHDDVYWNAQKRPEAVESAPRSTRGNFIRRREKTSWSCCRRFSTTTGSTMLRLRDNASSSLSCCIARLSHRMDGTNRFPTVENPTTIRLYSKNDSALTFLLTHESIAKVSVLTLSQAKQTAVQKATFPLYLCDIDSRNPRVLLPDAALQNKAIEFYVYSSAKQRSLSYFKQVSGTKFVDVILNR